MNEEMRPLSAQALALKIGGSYEHYSGRMYRILGVGRHSETLEEYVIYQALYGEQHLWVRPLELFVQQVEKQGVLVPRFTLKGSS